MPLYEYECLDCSERTEVIQRLSEPPLEICPHCGGKLQKLLSPPAVQFKGSGWYVTDYGTRSKTGAPGSTSAEAAGGKGTESSTGEDQAAEKKTPAPGAGSAGSTEGSSGS